MKTLKIIRCIFVWLMVALTVGMMIFTIVSVSTFDRADRNLFGYKAFIVLSDSMSKTDFSAGDLVLVKEVDPSTLKEGDIINVDVSTIYKGYFSDSSRMFIIGKTTPDKEKLVRVAKECVEEGIKAVKPWTFLGDMADAVNRHAKENGYSIVVDIGGHGVGLEFHEDPFVSYVTPKGTEMLMVPGMVFTIEPMVNAGTAEIYQDADNGWTIYTDDGKPSAQWEVTVAVTEDGCEVLVW